jgi:sugar lactone lactonase YvrE
VDTAGNVYFSEKGNNRVRKIDAASNVITTIAGNGIAGYSGDGSLATDAMLNGPTGLFVDKQGYIYICDYGNDVVRVVKPDGHIYTLAGNGAYGFSGSGGWPTHASFRGPAAVFVDDSGYVYIVDELNSVIWKMNSVSQINLGLKEIDKKLFSVYPNPSNGTFTISTDDTGPMEVSVFNTVGQLVYHQSFIGAKAPIDLLATPPGLYYIQCKARDGVKATQKIVIE